jgi:hypothetical protein
MAIITTTALINAIHTSTLLQIQLICTIVSKVTSHAKDEGKKEAKG